MGVLCAQLAEDTVARSEDPVRPDEGARTELTREARQRIGYGRGPQKDVSAGKAAIQDDVPPVDRRLPLGGGGLLLGLDAACAGRTGNNGKQQDRAHSPIPH